MTDSLLLSVPFGTFPYITVTLSSEILPLFAGVVCLALISMLMAAFNHIFSTLVPVEFAPYGRASTVSGIINSLIYVGCALSTYVFGAVSEHIGWGATVTVWLALMAASAVILAFCIKPWGRFLSKENALREDVGGQPAD